MSNTIKITNRTIEISDIDSDYLMNDGLNVESVVFIPGGWGDYVEIIESSEYAVDPIKTVLVSILGLPKVMYFNQNLRIGFTFANGSFSATSRVIFNIGEIN